MAETDINNHIFGDDESKLDLNLKIEIRFSKKNLPRGEMVPVYVEGKKEYVLIPLNIKDGMVLTVSGGGKHHSSSGETGDLYVLVRIEEKKFPWLIVLLAAVVIAAAVLAAVFLTSKPAEPPVPTTAPAPETTEAVCSHSWIPADCTTPQTCGWCGETQGKAADHEWKAADCTSPQTCVRCGAVTGTALEHQWKDATYDAPRTCSLCGITDGLTKEKPSVKVNDTLFFGRYEQDGLLRNGEEPIEWIVLAVDGDQALLLSRYALDSRPYNDAYEPVAWENCSLRYWLNHTFLNTAFDTQEQEQILLTELNNGRSEGNREWSVSGGSNTEDAVFLLSYADTDRYFDSQYDRMCMPTNYAVSNGADVRLHDDNITESGWWWLRSPGEEEHHAAFVNFDGTRYTNAVGNEYLSVRPALWIRLDGMEIS